MKDITTAAVAAALVLLGGLTACGSSPKATTAAPSPTPVFTDPMGKTCAPTALAGYNGIQGLGQWLPVHPVRHRQRQQLAQGRVRASRRRERPALVGIYDL